MEKSNAGRRLFVHALKQGAKRIGFTVAEWDVSGSCDNPIKREVVSHQTEGHPNRRPTPGATVLMSLPCRQCSSCLNYRSHQWSERAAYEIVEAYRTWMVTLTMAPSVHTRHIVLAQYAAIKSQVIWEEMNQYQQFRAIEKQAWPHVRNFLKRVRKVLNTKERKAGSPLRYLCVAEKHNGKLAGLPHYHLLVHQANGLQTINYADLEDQWILGFSKVKLIEGKTPASYVTKYLAKEQASRVRASLRYGHRLTDLKSQ